MKVDKRKLANIIYRLGVTDDIDGENPIWEEMADLADGPETSREVILGFVGVSVAVLRKYPTFPKGKFVSLQIRSEEPSFVLTYQMITASLNDDLQTTWALATTAVNQGMDWADEVMFSTAIACRYISVDFRRDGGIVHEDEEE